MHNIIRVWFKGTRKKEKKETEPLNAYSILFYSPQTLLELDVK